MIYKTFDVTEVSKCKKWFQGLRQLLFSQPNREQRRENSFSLSLLLPLGRCFAGRAFSLSFSPSPSLSLSLRPSWFSRTFFNSPLTRTLLFFTVARQQGLPDKRRIHFTMLTAVLFVNEKGSSFLLCIFFIANNARKVQPTSEKCYGYIWAPCCQWEKMSSKQISWTYPD
jgi:hypothetical protein